MTSLRDTAGAGGTRAALLQVALPLLLLAAAAIAYGTLVVRFAADVPNSDDFDMFVAFLVSFIDAGSLSEQLGLIFQRHNEHIIAACRLAAILSHRILGVVDFRALILAGNCAVPACLLLLMACWEYRGPARVAGVAAAGIALLQPQYLEASLWASVAVQNLWTMVFVLASLALAARATSALRGLLAATLLAVMAACTQANGIFASLLVAGIFVRRRYFAAAIVPAAFFVAALAYLQGTAKVSAVSAQVSILDYARYVLAFLGAPLGSTFLAAQLWGGLACVALVLLAWVSRRSPALLAVCLFVILTAVANAVARIHFGVDYAHTQSRYGFVALFFPISLCLLALERLPQRLQAAASTGALLVVAALAGWSFYAHLPEAEMRRNVLDESAFLVSATGSGFAYRDQAQAKRVYETAVERGVLRPLQAGSPVAIRGLSARGSAEEGDNACREEYRGSVERVVAFRKMALISGYILLRPGQVGDFDATAQIRGPSAAYVAAATKRPRPDAAAHHHVPLTRIWGFLAVVDTGELAPGSYTVRIIGRDGACLRTGKTLEIR